MSCIFSTLTNELDVVSIGYLAYFKNNRTIGVICIMDQPIEHLRNP